MDARRKREKEKAVDGIKPLPASEELEKSVLGNIFLKNNLIFECQDLSVDDFSHFFHQRIYRAMLELSEQSLGIDYTTVIEILKNKKELEDNVLGAGYVTTLMDFAMPRPALQRQYVDSLISLSRKRQIIYVATSALSAAYDDESKPDAIIEKIDRKLLEITSNRKSEPKKICDVLPEADRVIDERKKVDSDREAVGHPTGLDALDRTIKGYFKREVSVIAGETSDGKSTLARQGIIACGFLGIPQIVFSREVSREQLTIDLKTFLSGVFPDHVRDSRKMDLVEQGKFKEANCHLRNWPLWIDDSRNLHIYDLFHKARKLIRMEGQKYKESFIVWTDYIQLIQGSGSNQTERTEDVCAGHWTLADSENIPVVVLSQFNRESEKGKKMRPAMRRLKNASRIEQDAHTLVCPYMPENERGEVMPDQAEIIILKQRHGPRGSFKVRFDPDELIFKER